MASAQTTVSSKLKATLSVLLKIVIAFGAIWFLLLRNPDEVLGGFRRFSAFTLIPAIFFYFFHMLVVGWRWKMLTRILGVELPGFQPYSLTLQGYFFSLVIPGGAIGGDVAKMGLVSRRSQSGKKAEGAFTVFLDRVIGMIALFVLTLVLLLFSGKMLMRVQIPDLDPSLNGYWIAGFTLLCIAGLAASCVIFFHRSFRKIAFFRRWMDRADAWGRGLLSRMTDATDVYAGHWRELALLTVLSVFFVHIMTVIPFFFIFHGMGVAYSFFDVIVAVTIGNIVGLLPFLPAGVGGRDFAAVLIFVASGIPEGDAKAAMLIYTAILLVCNLAGGIFFILDPGHGKQKTNGTGNGNV